IQEDIYGRMDRPFVSGPFRRPQAGPAVRLAGATSFAGCHRSFTKTMNAAAREYESIYRAVATAITDRLPRNERVRRNLPGSGRLRIDRQLPFLVCHRFPADGPDLSTRELV